MPIYIVLSSLAIYWDPTIVSMLSMSSSKRNLGTEIGTPTLRKLPRHQTWQQEQSKSQNAHMQAVWPSLKFWASWVALLPWVFYFLSLDLFSSVKMDLSKKPKDCLSFKWMHLYNKTLGKNWLLLIFKHIPLPFSNIQSLSSSFKL